MLLAGLGGTGILRFGRKRRQWWPTGDPAV